MSIDNSALYKYVSDLLCIPLACKYIENAGGYIISTGLVWPIKTIEGETVYYYINLLDKEIRFLPDFSADLATAEVVTDQDDILFVFSHLIEYIQAINNQTKTENKTNQIMEIRFREGETPKLDLNIYRGLYVYNFSLS